MRNGTRGSICRRMKKNQEWVEENERKIEDV